MSKHLDKKLDALQKRIRKFEEISGKRGGMNKPGSLSGRK